MFVDPVTLTDLGLGHLARELVPALLALHTGEPDQLEQP